MHKLARVFPRKTSQSPDDEFAYFDTPDLYTPFFEEVHISVTFTWDIAKGYKLAKAWKDMPKKLAEYINSLPEFDNKIFREVTGYDISEFTSDDVIVKISRKSAEALGLV